METVGRRITMLRTMAIACAVLVLAITSLSAYIRLSRAGAGCEPWPQCRANVLREGLQAGAAPAGPVAAARVAHRISAVGALLLVIAMLMAAYASAPALPRQGRLVLALLALAVFLAVLGRMTADSRLPAVVMANLLAGLAMFAVGCRLVTMGATAAGAEPKAMPAGWVWLALVLLVLQILLGGLASAASTGAGCAGLAGCDPGASLWQGLNPWGEPAGGASVAPSLHRWTGVASGLVVAALAAAAWRRGRRAGAAVLALVALECGAGLTATVAAPPLAVLLAHNALAALLLAAVASLLPHSPRAG